MASRRGGAGSAIRNAPSTSVGTSPWRNAGALAAALGYGVWILVERGRLSWPPYDLMTHAYTLVGCVGLVGPLVLSRRGDGDEGLGEKVWKTGGFLIWVFDLAAVFRLDFRKIAWATPLDAPTMGFIVSAVLLASWRPGATFRWSWTNVIGWLLALVWIGIGLMAFRPNVAAS